MLTTDQINDLHHLYWAERWPIRKIEQHLRMSWRTIKKYLEAPAQTPAARSRVSKLDPFKPTIAELLEKDARASAAVIEQRLRPLGYDGGHSILREYIHRVRPQPQPRRAFVRMEPGPGERFEIDWGHFDALDYQGDKRKLYAFCLIEAEDLRAASLKLIQELRSTGLSVDYSLTAAKLTKVAICPLMNALFLPVCEITRRITNSSPAVKPIAVILSCRSLLAAISKNASTVAVSACVLIISVVALSPRSRLTAPIIIDFPAPVSPEITFRPSPKETCSSSIMAKFLMLNSLSIFLFSSSRR